MKKIESPEKKTKPLVNAIFFICIFVVILQCVVIVIHSSKDVQENDSDDTLVHQKQTNDLIYFADHLTGRQFLVPDGFNIESNESNVTVLVNPETSEAIVISSDDVYEKMHSVYGSMIRSEVDEIVDIPFLANVFNVSYNDVYEIPSLGVNWYVVKLLSGVNSDYNGLNFIYTKNGYQFYFWYISNKDPWNIDKAEKIVKQVISPVIEYDYNESDAWEVFGSSFQSAVSGASFNIPYGFNVDLVADPIIVLNNLESKDSICISVVDLISKNISLTRREIDGLVANAEIADIAQSFGVSERSIFKARISGSDWFVIKMEPDQEAGNKSRGILSMGVSNGYAYYFLYSSGINSWNFERAREIIEQTIIKI